MLTKVIVADWSKFRATSINDKADMNNATLDLEATLDHRLKYCQRVQSLRELGQVRAARQEKLVSKSEIAREFTSFRRVCWCALVLVHDESVFY
jgi:hypothetical protein